MAFDSTGTCIGIDWCRHCKGCEHSLSGGLGITWTGFDGDEPDDIEGLRHSNGRWPSASESAARIPEDAFRWKSGLPRLSRRLLESVGSAKSVVQKSSASLSSSLLATADAWAIVEDFENEKTPMNRSEEGDR